MAGRNAIQILRGAKQYDPSTSDVILNDGQPFYAKRTHELFVGDGSTPIKNLNPINSRKGLVEEDDLQGKITRIVFDVSSGDEIPFKYDLPGLTKIDWGDGTINTELTHTYTKDGVYECKLYGVTEITLNEYGPPEEWVYKVVSISLGNAITTIGNMYYMPIDGTSLPKSLTTIKPGAFMGQNFERVIIPDSVTSIGNSAFYDCINLMSVVIPDSVTTIGNYAFYDCDRLTSVVIPDSVTTIGEWAFADSSSLTSVEIGDGVTSIGESAFNNCKKLTSVVIGDGVTSIGEYAFQYCDKLTSVVIGKKVDHIFTEAFDNALNLTTVEFKSETPCTLYTSYMGPEIGDQQKVFTNCPNLTTIYVPYGCGDAYYEAWALYNIANLIVESDREAMMSDLNSHKAVLYKKQTLTEEEKAQARKNIGAAPEEVEYYVKIIMDNFPELMETYLANNAETTPIATKEYVDDTVLGGEW